MRQLEYYAGQSPFSDPGEYALLLDILPGDVAGLCRIVQGLYLHYDSGPVYGYAIPQERLSEIDLRWVRKMLARIIELDNRPLGEPRPLEKKLVGYCGSAATLLCAFARHKGLPARKRVGFAAYFTAFGPSNHEVAEIWDAGEACWKVVDPHLDALMVAQNSIQFDPCDVPRDSFIVGGMAWQLCRRGEADPDDFGIGEFRGWWMVRNCLIKDLAALNKMELLDWDNWGWCLKDFTAHTNEELARLDQVAGLMLTGKDVFTEILSVYSGEPGFTVPKQIMSFSPVSAPARVELDLNGMERA